MIPKVVLARFDQVTADCTPTKSCLVIVESLAIYVELVITPSFDPQWYPDFWEIKSATCYLQPSLRHNFQGMFISGPGKPIQFHQHYNVKGIGLVPENLFFDPSTHPAGTHNLLSHMETEGFGLQLAAPYFNRRFLEQLLQYIRSSNLPPHDSLAADTLIRVIETIYPTMYFGAPKLGKVVSMRNPPVISSISSHPAPSVVTSSAALDHVAACCARLQNTSYLQFAHHMTAQELAYRSPSAWDVVETVSVPKANDLEITYWLNKNPRPGVPGPDPDGFGFGFTSAQSSNRFFSYISGCAFAAGRALSSTSVSLAELIPALGKAPQLFSAIIPALRAADDRTAAGFFTALGRDIDSVNRRGLAGKPDKNKDIFIHRMAPPKP